MRDLDMLDVYYVLWCWKEGLESLTSLSKIDRSCWVYKEPYDISKRKLSCTQSKSTSCNR